MGARYARYIQERMTEAYFAGAWSRKHMRARSPEALPVLSGFTRPQWSEARFGDLRKPRQLSYAYGSPSGTLNEDEPREYRIPRYWEGGEDLRQRRAEAKAAAAGATTGPGEGEKRLTAWEQMAEMATRARDAAAAGAGSSTRESVTPASEHVAGEHEAARRRDTAGNRTPRTSGSSSDANGVVDRAAEDVDRSRERAPRVDDRRSNGLGDERICVRPPNYHEQRSRVGRRTQNTPAQVVRIVEQRHPERQRERQSPGLLGGLLGGVTSVLGGVFNGAGHLVGGVAKGVGSVLTGVGGGLGSLVQGIGGIFSGIF
jgi:hypothetical protein